MSVVAVAIGGSALLSFASSESQADAAQSAANAQSDSAAAGIAEQRRQFDSVRQLLAPYVNAGTGALTGQQDLIGLNGAAAQQGAISGIESSPAFAALLQQGENGILANASATGGLRGGNVQAALGQFRPQMLAQLIEQRYAQLGGLASVGQNAAAGVGNAGMSTGNNVASLLQQQGAAQAGAAVANGRASAGLYNGIASGIGSVAGIGGFGSAMPTAGGVQAGLSQTSVGQSGFGSGLAYGNQDLGQYF